MEGYNKLWGWFGLSRASFLVLPRVLMHEMPDEWQRKMAELLKEYDDENRNINNNCEIDSTTVRATKNGKLTKMPRWIIDYRHPNKNAIKDMKRGINERDM